jgi:hypothetical protein
MLAQLFLNIIYIFDIYAMTTIFYSERNAGLVIQVALN